MISLPPEIEELVETGLFDVRYMIRFDLDEGSEGLWNDTYEIEFDDVPFYPLGANARFESIPGKRGLNSDRVVLDIANLAPNIGAIISQKTWHQRPAVLFIALLDSSNRVAHVIPKFSGFLDGAPTKDAKDDTAILSLSIESNSRGLDRVQGRMRSDPDQRQVGGSTDGFFKNTLTATTNDEINWGRAGPQTPN